MPAGLVFPVGAVLYCAKYIAEETEGTALERILIIGGNGCGKTTFARALAEKLRLPLVHLDTLYWRDNWQAASNEEFDRLLQAELEKPRWILDGNMNRTIPHRLRYCDTVIYMDFPRWVCVWGVFWRELTNLGRSRPDMGGCCPERINLAFLKTVWNFNRTYRARYYAMLQQAPAVRVIVLKNRRAVRKFLDAH